MPSASGRRPDWDAHRRTITELYWIQEKPLDEVMETMRQVYGFDANKRQYKKQLVTVWRLAKNIREQDMRAMIRIQKIRRERYGKETCFTRYGVEVPPDKLRRFAKRHSMTEPHEPEYLADEQMVAPCNVRYSTPEPEVSSRTLPQATDDFGAAADADDAAAAGLSDHSAADFSPEQHHLRSQTLPFSPVGWHAVGSFPEPEPISPAQTSVDGRLAGRYPVSFSRCRIPPQPLAPPFSFEAMMRQDSPDGALPDQSAVPGRSASSPSGNSGYSTAPIVWGFGPFPRGYQAAANAYAPELQGYDDSVDPVIQSFAHGPSSWMASPGPGVTFHPSMAMHDSDSNITPSAGGRAYGWPDDHNAPRAEHTWEVSTSYTTHAPDSPTSDQYSSNDAMEG
ncbi:Clr5 domain-containing protein [Lasiosphaeris hirsuta]|uniref:Clr5 domain-containing protein n=1 Tax=Lasiosphaeris hirsuta TaxID=260670 RepID=A0AA40DKS4_9PEZI|nr:Clr5 domain-containing protein [Lasiosphaeris hirsuta]